MKLEQISLRTGFLLALAGWAAAVWLATGFGLGSQLPGADGDADAVPSLPVLPPLAAERMPSADSYRRSVSDRCSPRTAGRSPTCSVAASRPPAPRCA